MTIAEFNDPARGVIPRYEDDIYGPSVIVTATFVADPAIAQMVLDAAPNDLDGRSEFFWLRTGDGTLMLACFPRGDTYISASDSESV